MALPKRPKPSNGNRVTEGRDFAKNPRRGTSISSRQSSAGKSVENPYDSDDDEVFSPARGKNEKYYNSFDDDEYDFDGDVGFEDLEDFDEEEYENFANNVNNDDYDNYDDDDDDVAEEETLYSKLVGSPNVNEMTDAEYEDYEHKEKFYNNLDIPQDEVELASKTKKRKQNEKKNKNRGFFNSKEKKKKKDKKGADVYIDEDNIKLEPYAKRKIKVSEFDDRKNKQKKATYIQFAVLGLLTILVGAGLKNAILPPNTLNEEEVGVIALETLGETDFPKERARSLAENFIHAYLTVGGNDISSNALSFFYTGNLETDFNNTRNRIGSNSTGNYSAGGSFVQQVVIPPKAFESYSIDDRTGFFVVGALVNTNAELELDEFGRLPATEGNSAKWMFFNVNIFYDKDTDKLYVTEDSPTLVPDRQVGGANDAPDMGKIGNGQESDDIIQEEISSVIYGYVNGYANSSKTSYSQLQQYLSPDAKDTAKDGLNGEFELAGSNENTIIYNAYNTDDLNVLKVHVIVDWYSKITLERSTEPVASIKYKSNYIATLVRGTDGQWQVQNFDSMKFVPKEI